MNWRPVNVLRRGLERVGVSVSRFPGEHPVGRLVGMLGHHAIELVVDVGANEGGYARDLRRFGYRGLIESFEPLADPFQVAARFAAVDPSWRVRNFALGAESAEVDMHVAANHGASSSVLAMLPSHEAAAPEATIVGKELVRQRTLDDTFREHPSKDLKTFLKLDVQGYEERVLDGAAEFLASPLVVGLQIELSLVQLYEGSWLLNDVFSYTARRGFELWRIMPGFTDSSSGRMLQADGIFFRAGVC
jgi:FkbM family methyltransferase